MFCALLVNAARGLACASVKILPPITSANTKTLSCRMNSVLRETGAPGFDIAAGIEANIAG